MASKTARGAFENVSKSPGPGAYSINDTMIRAKAPNARISSPLLSRKLTERYFKQLQQQQPGPGQYNVTSSTLG